MKSAELPEQFPTRDTGIYRLSDLYDADRATAEPAVAEIRRKQRIPHPLREVQYADGVWRDSTAGRIHSQGRKVETVIGSVVHSRPEHLPELPETT